MTGILIVATSAVVRAGLAAILGDHPEIRVVGAEPPGGDLAEHIEALLPDVVLLELDRGDDSTGPALHSFPNGEVSPAFVLLADRVETADLADALRFGARSVLPRGAESAEIVAAVQAAAAGLVAFHTESAGSLIPLLASAVRTAPSSGTESLTPREVEVLAMLAEGAGNKLIARRLGISEHTVKFHVGSILSKLGAGSRTEAVTLGVRRGVIMV